MKSILFFLVMISLAGCNTDQPEETYLLPDPDVTKPSYAKGFHFSTIGDERFVQFFDLVNEEPVLSYSILLKDSTAYEFSLGKTVTLGANPDFATLSTAHLAYFLKIAGLDKVKGTAYAKWIQNESIKAEITKGSIVDISGEKDIDFEKLVSLNPTALLTYPYGDTDYSLIEAAGIAVIPFSEYLEKHPLGRAEWIKVLVFSRERDRGQCYFRSNRSRVQLPNCDQRNEDQRSNTGGFHRKS